MGKYDLVAQSARDDAEARRRRLQNFENLLRASVQEVAGLFRAEAFDVASALQQANVPRQKLDIQKTFTPRGWSFSIPGSDGSSLSGVPTFFVTEGGKWMNPYRMDAFEGLRYEEPRQFRPGIMTLVADEYAEVLTLREGAKVPTNLNTIFVCDGQIIVQDRNKYRSLEKALAKGVASRIAQG